MRSFYDALGRPTRTEQDSELGALVTQYAYLPDFVTRVTNPRGYATETRFQAFEAPATDSPVKIIAALGQPEQQTTDIVKNVLGQTLSLTRSGSYGGTPMALTRQYVYDDGMRLCKRVEPETGAALFEYDAGGNVAWTAEGQALTSTSACSNASVPTSERVTRSYDARNRLVLVDYPDATPDVATTYTADGKVATLGRAPTLLSYTYNKRGLLSSERLQFGAINWLSSHSYTTLGHLGATTYPSGHQVAYAPNALGQATQAGTYATGARYHPNGALAEFTYGNGIVHTMSRNLRQLPERSRSALGTNVVLDDSYDYDANGNVAAISDGLAGGPGDRDMSYDALDRLAGVVAGPAQGGNGSFAYDPLDNLRVLDQGSRQFRYHYDASNRLAQITSPTGALLHSFGYDARGNTTSKDSGTLSFDRENRLTHSALPTATTYLYDGLGRRVAEASPVSTYFYYSHEGKLLYTNDHKTQANTDHIYLSGSLVAARKVAFGSNPTITVTYQHTDALGSPVAFTDASGNVTRRERMTAWGEPADGTWSNEPGYTGHQMDAGSKLVYMQQRYYDPAIGTFLGTDPVWESVRNGDLFGRYYYANNSPLRHVDPDGRCSTGTRICIISEMRLQRRIDSLNETSSKLAHRSEKAAAQYFSREAVRLQEQSGREIGANLEKRHDRDFRVIDFHVDRHSRAATSVSTWRYNGEYEWVGIMHTHPTQDLFSGRDAYGQNGRLFGVGITASGDVAQGYYNEVSIYLALPDLQVYKLNVPRWIEAVREDSSGRVIYAHEFEENLSQ